ncbi:hypothetical protein LTS18_014152 [Coniosporium uncinatum]|uniref:Uncharacterized protein n=1 Tax=Coniosporium uncinatum TaxID=93489 RepID=A0ACC3CVR8_9PEZI|nr:hypothetical protein LTS18_014152 [Coniosporium uncinatum]
MAEQHPSALPSFYGERTADGNIVQRPGPAAFPSNAVSTTVSQPTGVTARNPLASPCFSEPPAEIGLDTSGPAFGRRYGPSGNEIMRWGPPPPDAFSGPEGYDVWRDYWGRRRSNDKNWYPEYRGPEREPHPEYHDDDRKPIRVNMNRASSRRERDSRPPVSYWQAKASGRDRPSMNSIRNRASDDDLASDYGGESPDRLVSRGKHTIGPHEGGVGDGGGGGGGRGSGPASLEPAMRLPLTWWMNSSAKNREISSPRPIPNTNIANCLY